MLYNGACKDVRRHPTLAKKFSGLGCKGITFFAWKVDGRLELGTAYLRQQTGVYRGRYGREETYIPILLEGIT